MLLGVCGTMYPFLKPRAGSTEGVMGVRGGRPAAETPPGGNRKWGAGA